MNLPSQILDISQPLDNDTVVDPSFMRPSIRYVTGKENAKLMQDLYPGLRAEDLPGGEGWAIEHIELTTHNGTHMMRRTITPRAVAAVRLLRGLLPVQDPGGLGWLEPGRRALRLGRTPPLLAVALLGQ